MVTTAFTLDGFHIERTVGIVRGIIVRSRSVFGTLGASLQTLVGGDITLFTNSAKRPAARVSAHVRACLSTRRQRGDRHRYDATEVMQGVTEVLCYGTAVIAKRD